MQVDLQKNFSLYLYIPEGVPKSKVVFRYFSKNTNGLQIKYKRGLFHNVAVMLLSCIRVLLFH